MSTAQLLLALAVCSEQHNTCPQCSSTILIQIFPLLLSSRIVKICGFLFLKLHLLRRHYHHPRQHSLILHVFYFFIIYFSYIVIPCQNKLAQPKLEECFSCRSLHVLLFLLSFPYFHSIIARSQKTVIKFYLGIAFHYLSSM